MKEIRDFITETLGQGDFESTFLVSLNVRDAKVEVFIDADDGVTLKRCQKLSRLVEAFVEEKGLMPEKYKIEVSSPGLDKPLKMKRQYFKNKGRKVQVKTMITTVEGNLENVDEDAGITVRVNKKKVENISWEDIVKCKVIPKF